MYMCNKKKELPAWPKNCVFLVYPFSELIYEAQKRMPFTYMAFVYSVSVFHQFSPSTLCEMSKLPLPL
jgi:hypothetical protein